LSQRPPRGKALVIVIAGPAGIIVLRGFIETHPAAPDAVTAGELWVGAISPRFEYSSPSSARAACATSTQPPEHAISLSVMQGWSSIVRRS